MGWYERLSGSDKPEGARLASVAERGAIRRWKDENKPLKSDESLEWRGRLLTGYHLHKTKKDESTEYVKPHLPGGPEKINTKTNNGE